MSAAAATTQGFEPQPLLRIDGLRTYVHTAAGVVKAVDGVDLAVWQGETLGVVGESGSGKTMIFTSVLWLVRPPGKIEAGRIIFAGRDLMALSARERSAMRGRDIAMTMQDALTALNPALTVETQIIEVLTAHRRVRGRAQGRDRALELMRLVGIPSAERRLRDYPHQFSGGMRQRIMIAIALACGARLLIADEPTAALDVTIQAEVLELIASLKRRLGMSVVLISHNLGVIARHCDRVAVIYAGEVVETGPTAAVLADPRHPYTRGLLRSVPQLDRRDQPVVPIPGEVPDPVDLPAICRFYDRCSVRGDACRAPIAMVETGEGRWARCIRAGGERHG
jgi:oligopeptide/dipeptide ABC transporter ATP-binding protein